MGIISTTKELKNKSLIFRKIFNFIISNQLFGVSKKIMYFGNELIWFIKNVGQKYRLSIFKEQLV